MTESRAGADLPIGNVVFLADGLVILAILEKSAKCAVTERCITSKAFLSVALKASLKGAGMFGAIA